MRSDRLSIGLAAAALAGLALPAAASAGRMMRLPMCGDAAGPIIPVGPQPEQDEEKCRLACHFASSRKRIESSREHG